MKVAYNLEQEAHQRMRYRTWTFQRRYRTRTTVQYTTNSRINSATDRRSSSQPEAKHQNRETVKRNLNNKLKVSNAEIHAFS